MWLQSGYCEAYLLAWWHNNQRFENDALMSVYIGSLVMDNNTEEKTKGEERYGIGLWCWRGYDKKRSHQWACRSWSIICILFFSFPDKSESYVDSHRYALLHRPPCVNPTNGRPSFCVGLVFLRHSLVRKPICRLYEFSSPPSQLVFKLPIKKQGGTVKLWRVLTEWGTDQFFLKHPRLVL